MFASLWHVVGARRRRVNAGPRTRRGAAHTTACGTDVAADGPAGLCDAAYKRWRGVGRYGGIYARFCARTACKREIISLVRIGTACRRTYREICMLWTLASSFATAECKPLRRRRV